VVIYSPTYKSDELFRELTSGNILTTITHHFARQTFGEQEEHMRSGREHTNGDGTVFFNGLQDKIYELVHSGKIKFLIFSRIS
jgi:hypothetical protein